MRLAFDTQNKLGRLCNESIYHEELMHQCSSTGLSVVSEGEIIVSYDSFSKSYYLDALIDQGAIYELKAVSDLNGQHESQLLNYLFLSDLQHGKLINFASASVQYRFVSTNINREKRFSFVINDDALESHISSRKILREIVLNLLTEWGAFLDIGLYREAMFHFLGGEEQLIHSVDISVDGRIVGHQKMCILNENIGLHLSSAVRYQESYRKQLSRLLNHANLARIQWVNFNRNVIQLITLKK